MYILICCVNMVLSSLFLTTLNQSKWKYFLNQGALESCMGSNPNKMQPDRHNLHIDLPDQMLIEWNGRLT